MNLYAHIFVDGEKRSEARMHACPRVGDTLRYGNPDKFAKVTEVIWCINEFSERGQRVNIRTVSEKP